MVRWKKIAALLLTGVMGMSLFACGSNKKKEDAESPEEMVEENMPAIEGDPIYIYSYNNELESRLQYFYDLYPEYQNRVVFINLDMGPASKDYRETIKELMKEGPKKSTKKNEEEDPEVEEIEEELPRYPSIVANDSIMGYAFIQNDYSVSISSLGITQEDMQNMYPYTLSAATFQEEVKGLTWNVSPGAFMYRTDIADEVLGESSPEAVQKMISNWNDFLKVAKKMKAAGYKMLSGSDEITYAMLQNKQTPWVVEENLRIDPNVKKCLDLAKQLQENEYTGDTDIKSAEREASFDSDVFGWFVYPGTVYGGINTKDHEGEYRICQGPTAFQWGSCYLTVSPECPDKDLAALVVKTLCCNEEVLNKMAKEELVNHKAIMEARAKDAKGNSMLGGQNPLEVWVSVEDNIKAENVTPYDGRFDSWIREISISYNNDEINGINKVFEPFKDKVSDTFNYIVVK